MQEDDARQSGGPAGSCPGEGLKKTPRSPKGDKRDKEARLAAALRENLRRRKAEPGKADRDKETD